jgi:hypothetical protein
VLTLNEDGTGSFLGGNWFGNDSFCSEDSDCMVTFYECNGEDFENLEDCEQWCNSGCEASIPFDEASCIEGTCEITVPIIWGIDDSDQWCYAITDWPGGLDSECLGYNLESDNTLIIIGTDDGDSCIEYVFELDSEEAVLQYFTNLPNETGESSLVIIQGGIDLEVGDEVGLFDSDGLVDGDGNTGEILVGAAVWTGEQLNVVGVESVDLSQFGGPILPGYQDGNNIVYKVWKASEDTVYDAEAIYEMGDGIWGDILTVVSILEPIFHRPSHRLLPHHRQYLH